MSHWVLTESLNDYDQHGEYYTASWDEKPTVQELISCDKIGSTSLNEDSAKKLLETGHYSPTPSMGLWAEFKLHFNKGN